MNASFEQRVEVALAGLVCADKHDLDLRLALRVRLFDTAADRKVFCERFGDEPQSHRLNVAAFLREALQQPAEQATNIVDAADVVVEPGVLREVLIEAAKKALFAVGLEALPPFELAATSHSLRRARLEAIATEEATRRSESQAAELRRAAALLVDFRKTDARPGDLLANVAPAERGGMVQALLRASAAEAENWTLQIVSGNAIATVKRDQPSNIDVEVVSDELGQLRCIKLINSRRPTARGSDAEPAARWASANAVEEQRCLRLVGAQSGVWFDDVASRFEAARSAQGFNGAIIAGVDLVATHSSLGVVRSSDAGVAEVIAAPPARCPHLLPDGRLLFASGREVIVENVVVAELPGEVVAVVPVDRRLAVIGVDGSVVLLDAATLDVLKKFSVSKAVRHAAGLPWLGSARLVLATDAGVSVVGPDDGLSLDRSVPGGCKVVAAMADTIAAVTGDRQRVLLFSTWDASAEPQTIYVTATTRHRVGDLAFSISS